MAKPEWGTKRQCLSCGTKFYDMQRNPIVCPSCGAEFQPEEAQKSRRGKTVAKENRRKAAAAPAEEETFQSDLGEEDLNLESEDEGTEEAFDEGGGRRRSDTEDDDFEVVEDEDDIDGEFSTVVNKRDDDEET